MKKIAIFAVALAIANAIAAPFVTPSMMKRNGLTDEQYQLLWAQGKNPRIGIAEARDWIFRASRYTNVVEWLDICGRTNDFARLAHKLQGDNFDLVATNGVLKQSVQSLTSRVGSLEYDVETWRSGYEGATNRIHSLEIDYSSVSNRAARLDALRSYLVEQRDKAALPTTKAIYQALIDRIDAEGNK